MPYAVTRQGDKWVVSKADDDGEPIGDPLGTHDSKEKAQAQQRALYASENKSWAVKMTGDDSIEGPGMPFGGPFNGQDLDGEHFSIKTDFAFDWFPERPLLYHHGLDNDAGIAVVGRVKSWDIKTDLGVWTKAQLDASSEYFDAIKELVNQGKLFFSSGAMRHLVKVNQKSGEITRWPWVELSLTPTPSNLLAEVQTAEKHFDMAGLKAVWLDGLSAKADLLKMGMMAMRKMVTDIAEEMGVEMSDSEMERMMGQMKDMDEKEARSHAKQEMDKMAAKKSLSGSYEELMAKLNHAVNPMSPFTNDCWSYVVATFPGHMIVSRHEDGEETFWKIPYSFNDGEPILGPAQQIEQVFLPSENKVWEMPLTIQTEYVGKAAVSLLERTKDLQERRVKEGRMISAANRKRLMQCMDSMRSVMDEMESLMNASEPPAKASVSLWRLRMGALAINAP